MCHSSQTSNLQLKIFALLTNLTKFFDLDVKTFVRNTQPFADISHRVAMSRHLIDGFQFEFICRLCNPTSVTLI